MKLNGISLVGDAGLRSKTIDLRGIRQVWLKRALAVDLD